MGKNMHSMSDPFLRLLQIGSFVIYIAIVVAIYKMNLFEQDNLDIRLLFFGLTGFIVSLLYNMISKVISKRENSIKQSDELQQLKEFLENQEQKNQRMILFFTFLLEIMVIIIIIKQP